MDKTLFQKFARTLGFNVSADAIQTITNEAEYDADYPDNWDEMTEDEKEAWKQEHMVKAQAQDKPKKPAPKEPAPTPELPDEVLQFSSLIKELGGVDSLRTLLLSAATVTANALTQEEAERGKLVDAIIANSADQFSKDELEEIELPVLRKMASALTPQMQRAPVDYGALGSVQNKGKDKIAERPVFLLNRKAKE